MPAPQVRVGGSFAPPLTDELLVKYERLIAGTSPQSPAGDYARQLLKCCKAWWELPESTRRGRSHPVGNMVGKDGKSYAAPKEVPLEEEHQKALWDLIPWRHELDLMGEAFNKFDPIKYKELRHCCYHLLWHVRELDNDREPITNDKLEEI